MNFGLVLTKLLGLVNVIQNTPGLLAAFLDLVNAFRSTKEGALSQTDKAAITKELEACPEAMAILKDIQSGSPAGSEAFSLGGIAAFLAFLPQLIELFSKLGTLFPKK